MLFPHPVIGDRLRGSSPGQGRLTQVDWNRKSLARSSGCLQVWEKEMAAWLGGAMLPVTLEKKDLQSRVF